MALLDALGYDGKTYDAKEWRQLVASLTGGRGGVTDVAHFKATPSGTPDLKVHLAAGQFIVPASSAGLLGSFEIPNDADLASPNFTAPGASVRWDKLIVQVDGSGNPGLVVVQGTPGSASYPSLAGLNDYEEVCGVKFPAGASVINNTTGGIIDDRRKLWPRTVICTSTTRPAVPYEGQEIIETDTDKRYLYSGSAWIPLLGYGARTAYTPTLTGVTSNPNVGSTGTKTGRYNQFGKEVRVEAEVSFGGTGIAAGSGDYRLSLPVTARAPLRAAHAIGTAWFFDSSTFQLTTMQVLLDTGGTYVTFAKDGILQNWGATVPAVPATGDSFTTSFTFEAA